MKEQSTPQPREATTPVKLVAADVLLSRKNEIQDVIARRAYELFKGHGSVNGHDIDDVRDHTPPLAIRTQWVACPGRHYA